MVIKYLNTVLTDRQKELMHWNTEVTQSMLYALENALINNDNGIGLPYWAKQNPLIVRDFTFIMSKLNLATVKVKHKYARLEFNTSLINNEEFKQWRLVTKLNKVILREDTKEYPSNLVKVNGKNITTGIDRKGFAKVAKNSFMIDRAFLFRYKRAIKQNLIKSIKIGIEQGKIKDKFFEDKANYRIIVNYAVQYYLNNANGEYNLEANVSDQRGRSIFKALKRIGNPISSKDFRALLVVPRDKAITIKLGDSKAINDIFYFVGELTGSKASTEAKKIRAGFKAYKLRELPILNLKSEEHRKDLHELIWLERIYKKLDILYSTESVLWNIPLEIDCSMSIAQIIGALTNDKRLLESTNVIGNELTDPWEIKGVRRSAGKTGVAIFYGSSQSPMGLLRAKQFLFEQILTKENPNATKEEIDRAKAKSKQEVTLIRKEFATGRFSIIKQFKDLMIQNFNVQRPIIPVKLYKDEFNVHVNKFEQAGVETIVTEAYDTISEQFKYSYTHEPILIPDYKYMKLFWATCAIHGLDSQIMNYIAERYSYMWMLTIHDAILGLPGQLSILRQAYADELKEINKQRHSIIKDYRKSIGATSFQADVDYYRLCKSVVESEDIPFLATAMK